MKKKEIIHEINLKRKVRVIRFLKTRNIIFNIDLSFKKDNRYTYILFLYTYTLSFIHIHFCLLNSKKTCSLYSQQADNTAT
jgi:hypothetical protein